MDFLNDWQDILTAFWVTLQLLVYSGLASLVLGTLLAAMRVCPVPVLRWTGTLYVNLFRNTPLLMVFVIVTVMMPSLDLTIQSYLLKGVVALTVYTSAFVCEAVRSGINAVPLGQAEASRAIGLTFAQSMANVVLPQAFRAVVPPLASVLIAMAKNTSVAAVFGVLEATARMRGLTNNFADERYAIFLVFAAGYIVIVEIMSYVAARTERRWRVAGL